MELNDRIIEMEKKKSKEYIKMITQKFDLKKDELDRHEKLKPETIEKPTDLESLANDKEIEKIRLEMDSLNRELNNKKQALTQKTIYHQKLLNIQSGIERLVNEIEIVNNVIKSVLNTNVDDGIIKVAIPHSFYTKEIDATLDEINKVQKEINDLEELINSNKQKIHKLTESTTLKNKLYQEYINKIKQWEEVIKLISGDEYQVDSLCYLDNELKYLHEKLDADYKELILQRDELIAEIFNEKMKIANVYDEIYTPIEKLLTELLGEIRDEIKFKTNFVVDSKKMMNVLQNINRRPQSLFQGVNESEKKLLEIVETYDWEDIDGVQSAIKQILSCGLEDDFEKLGKVITDKKHFYNQVTSLEYLGVDFQLTYQDTDLTELSPGERGLVLLTFYLALSKDNTPIIIDQPEDNLDNQSVFSKLVPCILEAKKKRQVIIVTHNPNIAIACDAEQIIVANMDKVTKKIRYSSGSIENMDINKKLIEILEGTRPAFDLREAKYLKV